MNSGIPGITRRRVLLWAAALSGTRLPLAVGAPLEEIAPQPYFAAVERALETLEKLGSPVDRSDVELLAALARQGDSAAVQAAEKALDRYTLARITVLADGYPAIAAGGAQRSLIEQGWRLFLIRVSNPTGSTAKLSVFNGTWPPTKASSGASTAGLADTVNPAPYIEDAWLASELYTQVPMTPALSGFPLEYAVIQLHSRDRGVRSAEFYFSTSDDWYAVLAARFQYRRRVKLAFDCKPSRDVILRVRDDDGRSCMASLTIKDQLDRIYPLQAMRLAPDLQFQRQIYRADGETVRLPDGEYRIETRRGPEYVCEVHPVTVEAGTSQVELHLKRWVEPSKWGWYSGDTHIHAAGCAHYERPTEGVAPETIVRQVRGEGLSIGDILAWGPSWYYQNQFFSGHAISPAASLEHPELQRANHATLVPHPTEEDGDSLLRYDVEVSGFPSSHCGHLVLLNLERQEYPGAKIIQEWPSWNLPILKWAKAQGAIGGYGHIGDGMVVDSTDLPNYEVPPMDLEGANEAIVDVTTGLLDFLSGCNGAPRSELNVWYHLMNCGFRIPMVGETDWPCVTGERPGVGRSYVHLDSRPTDDRGYIAWVNGMKAGRLYCGDGRSHFLEFQVNGRRSGDDDLTLGGPATVRIQALIAARLEPQPPDLSSIRHVLLNGWHLENARVGTSRGVVVELVVNGVAVANEVLLADGNPRRIEFNTKIERSSWIALRILTSAHTYPVFVRVNSKPIRASRRSARWCSACVEALWQVKAPFMRESERAEASAAFSQARKVYDTIATECEID